MSSLSFARPAGAALLLVVGLAATAALLYLWWPAGIVLGGTAGVLAVAQIGLMMQRAAAEQPLDEVLEEELVTGQVAVQAHVEEARPQPRPQATRQAAALPETARQDATVQAAAPQPAALQAAAPQPAAAQDDDAQQEQGVRADLERLKAELGDAWPDFARAARFVVSTQYASAARLQRELQVPYSRARRLLDGLEHEHFVGPKTGSLPRQVLLPKERLPEVERLLAEV